MVAGHNRSTNNVLSDAGGQYVETHTQQRETPIYPLQLRGEYVVGHYCLPCSTARRTSSATDWTSSLSKIWLRCSSTVRWLMPRMCAMVLLDCPATTSLITSCSRSVRLATCRAKR